MSQAEASVNSKSGSAPDGQGCCQPTCPLCTGVLIPLRGFWRCVRCRFTLCEECEGGPAGPACGD
jgi:hypothetical protein